MIRLWNRLVPLHSSKFVQKTMTIGWQPILLENLCLRKVLQGKSTLTFGWLIYDLWMIYPWVDKHCNVKDIIYRWFPPTRTSKWGFPRLVTSPSPESPGVFRRAPAAVTAAAATATPAVGRSVEGLEEVAMEERPSGMVSWPLKALTDGVII